MNFEDIKRIPFKEKSVLVTEVCLMYRKLKGTNKHLLSKKPVNSLSDSIIDGIKKNTKAVSIFETVLSLLDTNLSTIIKNDFIDNIDKRWYENSWSKTTYYKLKHQAVDIFLSLIYV